MATSEASARVGRGAEIIDSSIWVATMTGLAQRRAAVTICFCTSGTSSSGSSTPRSPRATMKASKASMISSRLATACGFSSLAMTGTRRPSSSITWCTSSMSLALRTKDRATMSMPCRSAQRRSSMSFSLIAGTLTATPGRLMPLLLLTGPPTTTSVTTSVSVTSVARSVSRPSSIKIRSPGWTSPGRPLYVVEHRSTVPGTSSMVMANRAPSTRVSLTGGEPAQPDLRALQVGQHADRPTGRAGGLAYVGAGWSRGRSSPRGSC